MADFTITKTPLDNGYLDIIEYVGVGPGACPGRTEIKFGADDVTVRCERDAGHEGNHVASGNGHGWQFRMQWGEAEVGP